MTLLFLMLLLLLLSAEDADAGGGEPNNNRRLWMMLRPLLQFRNASCFVGDALLLGSAHALCCVVNSIEKKRRTRVLRCCSVVDMLIFSFYCRMNVPLSCLVKHKRKTIIWRLVSCGTFLRKEEYIFAIRWIRYW
mmetsp:Transcript_31764/g.48721  ORF Transcript_31764/g.48721 Transcript_31764/m.48721 type:complete len:135 (+) Transcript_31764:1578-1982(+)